MGKTDDFDQFLKKRFEETKTTIADEGFTKKVMSNLPTKRVFTINRTFILYLSGILSILVFIISSGYKALFYSLIDIFTNGLHMIRPSFISFFVIIVFLSVSFIISRIEHDDTII